MQQQLQPAPIDPIPTPTSQPFWDALADGRVELQQCDACHSWVYYPRSRCTTCLSADLVWKEIAGTGTLSTFTVARQPTTSAFAEVENLILAVVTLDQGPKMTSSLENVEIGDVVIGMRLAPLFVRAGEQTLLRHQPA
jgi:uncharacterized OB-fold protein